MNIECSWQVKCCVLHGHTDGHKHSCGSLHWARVGEGQQRRRPQGPRSTSPSRRKRQWKLSDLDNSTANNLSCWIIEIYVPILKYKDKEHLILLCSDFYGTSFCMLTDSLNFNQVKSFAIVILSPGLIFVSGRFSEGELKLMHKSIRRRKKISAREGGSLITASQGQCNQYNSKSQHSFSPHKQKPNQN